MDSKENNSKNVHDNEDILNKKVENLQPTDFIPDETTVPAELKPLNERGVGIKPEFLADNMDITYENRRKHLNDWMKKKLLNDPAARIKIENSIVKPTPDNLSDESKFTFVNYKKPLEGTLPEFKPENEPVKEVLKDLPLVYMSASGNGNNCAFHSFLQAISPLFRALNNDTKDKIALAFRFEYIKFVIINTNGADMQDDDFCNDPLHEITEKSKIRDTYSSGLDEDSAVGSGITNFVYFGTVKDLNGVDRFKKDKFTPVSFIELNSLFFGYNLIMYTTSPDVLELEKEGLMKSIVETVNPIHKVNDTIFIWNQGDAHFETIGYKNQGIPKYKFVFKDDSDLVKTINRVAETPNICGTTDIVVKPNNVTINNNIPVKIYSNKNENRTVLQTENTGCLIIYCFNTLQLVLYDDNTNSLKKMLKRVYKINDQEIALTIPNFCFIVFDYCENKKNPENPIKIYLVLNFTFNHNDSWITGSDLFFIKEVFPDSEEFRTKNFVIDIDEPITKTHVIKLDDNTGNYNIFNLEDLENIEAERVRVEQERLANIEAERVRAEQERLANIEAERKVKEEQLKIEAERKKAELETLAKEMGLSVNEYLEHLETEKKKTAAEKKKNIEQQNLIKEYYKKKLNSPIDNTQLKINKLGEMKLEKSISTGQNKFDVDKKIQNLIDTSVIKQGMFLLVNDEVYTIESFGSIIVNRNFDKDYPADTLIIFYSAEKQEYTNIISLILKKYNEKFDENENNENNKIMIKNNMDFKKLLLEIDKVEKETKCVTDNKELFLSNPNNIKSIHEMNFIQDINLVTNIVKYRKLEIKKQIRIISLSIEVYKYVLIQIKCVDFKLELNKEKLLKDRQKCVEIFDSAIFKNSYFLQDTLCRYIELEDKLKSFSKK